MVNQENKLIELQEKGIVVIEDYVSKSFLSALNIEFDEFLAKDHVGAPLTPYSKGKCARVKRDKFDKETFPNTSKLFYNENFKFIAEKYLKGKVSLNEEIFVVKDVVGSKHFANDLHYDVVNTLKFFLYLSDTKTSNGAFSCVPGSHILTREYRVKHGIKLNYENRYLTRELDLKNFRKPITIEGQAGTLILFDTDTWHKAGKVSRGERRVMRGHTRLEEKFKTKDNKSIFNKFFNGLIRRIK